MRATWWYQSFLIRWHQSRGTKSAQVPSCVNPPSRLSEMSRSWELGLRVGRIAPEARSQSWENYQNKRLKLTQHFPMCQAGSQHLMYGNQSSQQSCWEGEMVNTTCLVQWVPVGLQKQWGNKSKGRGGRPGETG